MMRQTVPFFPLILILLLGCEAAEKDKAGKEKKDPIKNGVAKSYFKDGSLRAEIAMKDGKKNGLAVEYYQNGNKFQEVTYKDGVKEGIARIYFETGQLSQETNYHKGNIHGIQRKFRANGKQSSEAEFFEGEPCLGLKEYLTNGALKKKYPEIRIEPYDRILEEGLYILKLSMSEQVREVEFFVGQLSEHKHIGSKAAKVWNTDKYGKGEVVFQLPPGHFIMEKVNVIAKVKTTLGNYFITQKSFNVAVENR